MVKSYRPSIVWDNDIMSMAWNGEVKGEEMILQQPTANNVTVNVRFNLAKEDPDK